VYATSQSGVVLVRTYRGLRAALEGSASVIRMGAGTYEILSPLGANRDVTMVADVPGSVILDGMDMGFRGAGVHVTPDDECITGRQILSVSGAHVELIGLTLQYGCFADGNAGGGSLIALGEYHADHAAHLTMTGCVLRYGFSKYAGGAMYLNGNSATIKNCTFTYNFGGFEGGAISAAGGALDVSDSIFSHNTAESGGAGAAIGISGDYTGTSVACVVTVRRCSFFANDGDGALSAGGASAVSMHEC
jgi:hypothetical protein